MDKTIKINLGGVLFQIDEEAYKMLRQYLNEIDSRLRNMPGGSEAIEDIESRIAEIFQSQKGNAGVVTKENVESVISIIGKPETFDYENSGDTARQPESSPKILYRNPDDSIISGVCGGLAVYMNIQSVWIRVLFILATFLYGIGFFVYIALWIALPLANTDVRRKEMYGGAPAPSGRRPGQEDIFTQQRLHSGPQSQVNVGGAVNEVFRSIGKAFIIIARVILAIIGVSLVIAGFVALASFIMVFIFKYPGYFSTDELGFNLVYIPDFLNYIVSPASALWIKVLVPVAVILPLLAFIYWGLKMIFWFRAKDGIISLTALVLWVLSLSLLSIILFSEGVSFAETAKSTSEQAMPAAPKELYIKCDRKVSDLNYDKSISFEDDYKIYLTDESRDIYIRTMMEIFSSDDNTVKIRVKKRSAGRSKEDAYSKTDRLIYNYRISGDTIFTDEYFTVPSSGKWAFDNVRANIFIPEGTIVHFDTASRKMLDQNYWSDENENDGFVTARSGEMILKDGILQEIDR
ncbi:MAG: PspC domain-containing protein [Bacteroidales bacterium]|nr:PspC domain-containing protein [Bacteroidales bacterium]